VIKGRQLNYKSLVHWVALISVSPDTSLQSCPRSDMSLRASVSRGEPVCFPWFHWYSLCIPTEGWPGWVDMGLFIHGDGLPTRRRLTVPELNRPCRYRASLGNYTDRDRPGIGQLTTLIETNALAALPLSQTTNLCQQCINKILQHLTAIMTKYTRAVDSNKLRVTIMQNYI